jgi:hypothetical protein
VSFCVFVFLHLCLSVFQFPVFLSHSLSVFIVLSFDLFYCSLLAQLKEYIFLLSSFYQRYFSLSINLAFVLSVYHYEFLLICIFYKYCN